MQVTMNHITTDMFMDAFVRGYGTVKKKKKKPFMYWDIYLLSTEY